MRSILLCLFPLGLLAACASSATDPAPVVVTAKLECDLMEPQTGSKIVRRERCTPATKEEREAARELVDKMRDLQLLERANELAPKTGAMR